jgi:hypothetical protein
VTEFDKVIPPGGVGKVTASLDTSHYGGRIVKGVSVTTGDPGARPVVLQLKANVVSVYEIAPGGSPSIRTSVGEPGSAKLTLWASKGKLFDVLGVESDPRFAITVRPAPEGAPSHPRPSPRARRRQSVASGSSRYLLTITTKPDLPVGTATANVTLTTDLGKAERIPLQVFVLVSGRVRVLPDRLLARPVPFNPILHATISKRTGDGFRILGVKSSDPDFVATTSPITKGREYDLTVRYTGKPGRGPVNSQITVRTNEPGQNVIVIPLIGSM